MKYFFVLGSNPTLSLAELSAKFSFSAKQVIANDQVAIWNAGTELDMNKAITQLGGTIKIGSVMAELKSLDKNEIVNKSLDLIKDLPIQGKINFGFSYYGRRKIKFLEIGITLKRMLQNENKQVRFVTSKEKNLSSVVVSTNKLLTQGIELVIIEINDHFYLGQTISIQPFRELSHRDYGRPSRDDYSGMLPPKLAQIMINLSQAKNNDVVLDPFCGSGTILSEAALMGYNNIIGADISDKAIEDTKDNLTWIENNFKFKILNLKLLKQDVKTLDKVIEQNFVDAIITEPYLGPQRGNIDRNKIISDLENLYNQALAVFNSMLKKNGRIVMVWPVLTGRRSDFLNIRIDKFIPVDHLAEFKFPWLKKSFRNTIVYGREGQKVWREIIVLEKK